MHVVLVGSMGSGKTTVGAALAERLGWPFSDSDAWIEETLGVTGAVVAGRDGVAELHRREAEHLLSALASEAPLVVAAAASVADDPRCLSALDRAFVVWLDPPLDALVDRVAAGAHRRDLRDAGETADSLRQRRLPAYAQVADLHITGTPEPDAIVARVLGVEGL